MLCGSLERTLFAAHFNSLWLTDVKRNRKRPISDLFGAIKKPARVKRRFQFAYFNDPVIDEDLF